jgi:hypothetical protein
MSDNRHKRKRKIGDGRLCVRTGNMLPLIRKAAAKTNCTPSNWIRLIVRRALSHRRAA